MLVCACVPPRIDNPKYKGIWVAPDIDNPDFKDDPKLHLQKDIKYIGFELWQVGLRIKNAFFVSEFAEVVHGKSCGRWVCGGGVLALLGCSRRTSSTSALRCGSWL